MWTRSLLTFVRCARASHCLPTFNAVVGTASRSCSSQIYDQQCNNSEAGQRLQTPEWKGSESTAIRPNEGTINRLDARVEVYCHELNRIAVKNGTVKPIVDFDKLQIGDFIEKLAARKSRQPTLVQAQGWSFALSGSNMMTVAQTGFRSSKTLGYMLPAIAHIKNQPCLEPGDGPIVLVLAPTNELVHKIQTVAYELNSKFNTRSTCLSRGTTKARQIKQLNCGAEIAIATPDRLRDLLESAEIDLHRCSYLVLDEVDRMLDMGFEPQIRQLIGKLRLDRQRLMWSATWSRELDGELLGRNRDATASALELTANPNIKQIVRVCHESEKLNELRCILSNIIHVVKGRKPGKILIFAKEKRTVEHLTRFVERNVVHSDSIHSGKMQAKRDHVMTSIRTNHVNVVVTDLIGWGSDVDGIVYVINYDYPDSLKDYIQSIGRVGRRDNEGTAYTLFTEKNAAQAVDLIRVLEDANQEVDSDLYKFASSRPEKQAAVTHRRPFYDD